MSLSLREPLATVSPSAGSPSHLPAPPQTPSPQPVETCRSVTPSYWSGTTDKSWRASASWPLVPFPEAQAAILPGDTPVYKGWGKQTPERDPRKVSKGLRWEAGWRVAHGWVAQLPSLVLQLPPGS